MTPTMPSPILKPRISILLPAIKGYDSVLPALDSWEAQSCRNQLEILILCPDHLASTASQREALSRGQVVVLTGNADLHQARTIGIQHASGEYIMLAEDHCLPDPDWAQAILGRLQEGWDAVGPALRPGNRSSAWTEGSFLIGYGEWMMPVKGGPTDILCGWNGTVRTELLREMGAELPQLLLLGAFLIRRLQQQGCRFYLEDRARMRHFDPSGCARENFLLLLVGLGFGAKRTRPWPLAARILYPLATPAIAFLHWRRAFKHYRRAGSESGVRPSAVLAAVVLATSWGLGEAAGSWLGIERVEPYLWRTEVKPAQRKDVARSDAQERIGSSNLTGVASV